MTAPTLEQFKAVVITAEDATFCAKFRKLIEFLVLFQQWYDAEVTEGGEMQLETKQLICGAVQDCPPTLPATP